MRNLFVLVLTLCTLTLSAQKKANPDRYASTITAADLQKHLYIIAGPEMEGRETATEGERKAAAYLEKEFRRIGLQPGNNGSFFQDFNLYQDTLLDAVLQVNNKSFELNKDFTIDFRNVPSTNFNFAEIVFVGLLDTTAINNLQLAGKSVLVLGDQFNTQNQTNRYAQRLQAIRNKGAFAILQVNKSFPQKNPQTRKFRFTVDTYNTGYEPLKYTVSEDVAKAILGLQYDSLNQFAASSRIVETRLNLSVNIDKLISPSRNVVGIIPGTDLKDEYLILTAHYDHEGKRNDSVIYYGADDDGSGTVSLIELAEAFMAAKKAGNGPRRTLVFMPVSGEEKGLLGSRFYSENPIFPLQSTTANLNIDMIGRIDPKRKKGDSTNYVYVVGDDKLSSELRPISEAANRKTKLELDYKYNDPDDKEFIYYRSDHYNFARKGVPIIFYFNGTHADYHKPTDTPDKINYPLLAKRARLVFYTAWEMANRNEMVKRDRELPVWRS